MLGETKGGMKVYFRRMTVGNKSFKLGGERVLEGA
jgi:hypothetical protein